MTDWQSALEAVAADYTRGTLERDARAISEAYRLKTGEGKRLLTRESEAAAYALSRMPATVEAARAALAEALEASGLAPRTMLDCGAGTGAVTFAAARGPSPRRTRSPVPHPRRRCAPSASG